MFLVVALAVGSASPGAADPFATPTWYPITGSVSPGARAFAGSALDEPRHRMIVFGGYRGQFLNDAFELSLDSDTWAPLNPAGAPPSPRDQCSLVYDSARDRMLLVGGNGPAAFLGDLWELSLAGSTQWTERPVLGDMPPLYAPSVIYDRARDRLLSFGGYATDGTFRNQLYELPLGVEPLTWHSLLAAGTELPAGRYGHVAVYDPVGDRMIVYGGRIASQIIVQDTWELALSADPTWHMLQPSGVAQGALASIAVYDSARQRIINFGGYAPSTGGWAFSGEVSCLSLDGEPAWTTPTTNGIALSPRAGAAGIYDPIADRLVLFGGTTSSDNSNVLSDAAALAFAGAYTLHVTSDQPAFGSATAAPFAAYYPWGRVVTLTAHPATGYLFDHWDGDVIGSANPTTITMDADKSVVAHFRAGYALTTSIVPVGAGGVVRVPEQPGYEPNAVVSLTPVPAAGCTFVRWEGDASGHEIPLELTMDGPKHVWAVFDGVPPGCGLWTDLNAVGPGPREGPAIAMDPVRGRVLLFGGERNGVYFGDLWELSLATNTWTRIDIAVSPVGRRWASMIYDAARDRMILFGGVTNSYHPWDMWALSLSAAPVWTPLTPSGDYVYGRDGSVFVYDSVQNRALLFSGTGDEYAQPDTYILSLGETTPVWFRIPTAVRPDAGTHDCGVFDPVGNRVLVLGRNGLGPAGVVWALSLRGTPTWSSIDVSGVGPSQRSFAGSAYDPIRRRMIVFGGQSGATSLDDGWALALNDEPSWTRLTQDGAGLPRGHAEAAFDSVGDQLLILGSTGAVWGLAGGGNTLALAITPQGAGAITRSPDSACYAGDAQVLLTAVPQSGYGFTGWGGDAIGTANPLTVSMAVSKSIVAHFDGFTLTTSALPAGSGTINRSPDQPRYAPGSVVSLVPVPSPGFVFDGWVGESDPNAVPLELTMTQGRNVTARFAELLRCGTWDEMPSGPGPRSGAAMSYDPSRNALWLFGGQDAGGNEVNDVWRLDLPAGAWAPVITENAPAPRARTSMVYDPGADRLVLFGGSALSAPYNDTWSLPLAGVPTWIELVPGGAPPGARDGATLVYDSIRQRALLFGGYDEGASRSYGDTWELTLSGAPPVWNRLSLSSPAGSRRGHAAAFDPVRNRMIVFAGAGPTGRRDDSWSLSLAGPPVWTALNPAGELPPARSDAAFAYDPERQRLDVFGGSGTPGVLNDTWALSLKYDPAWVRLATSGAAPVVRAECPGAFDIADDQFVMFGGINAATLSDTWRLLGSANTLDAAAEWPDRGSVSRSPEARCYEAGSEVVLTATPAFGFKFSGWMGDASGTTNPMTLVMDGSKAIIARFDPVAVATQLASFGAGVSGDGIELRWHFGDAASVHGAALERASHAEGPWSTMVIDTRSEADGTVALDRSVEPDHEYFYRLIATFNDGSVTRFGPVSSRSARIVASAITGIEPNPSPGTARVGFTAAEAGRFRLQVLDIAGRVVATLTDGIQTAGHHQVTWDGRAADGPAPTGLYFVRLVAPDRAVIRRLAITR